MADAKRRTCPEDSDAGSDDAESRASALLAMVNGYRVTQLLAVATRLRLADRLSTHARRAEEVALETGTHAPSLHRLMRALAGSGLFEEHADGSFSLTPMGELLRGDHRESLAPYIGEIVDWSYRVWGSLDSSIRTGLPAFDEVVGMAAREYRHCNEEARERYQAWTSRMAASRGKVLLDEIPFFDGACIVDLGGGDGTLLVAVLGSRPTISGVVLETEAVAALARASVARASLADRCEVREGDFFARVPPGGDFYVLSDVLLTWSDDDARRILSRCHEAMTPDALLLVVDLVMPGPGPHFAKIADITMLLTHPGARIRSEAEWRTLLSSAGFDMTRTVLSTRAASLLVARRT